MSEVHFSRLLLAWSLLYQTCKQSNLCSSKLQYLRERIAVCFGGDLEWRRHLHAWRSSQENITRSSHRSEVRATGARKNLLLQHLTLVLRLSVGAGAGQWIWTHQCRLRRPGLHHHLQIFTHILTTFSIVATNAMDRDGWKRIISKGPLDYNTIRVTLP